MNDPLSTTGPQVMGHVSRRLLPLLALAFLCNYLDKVNIGFAALQMNAALGLSHSQFGLAAGAFALGYMLFAVPSALMLHKVGARRWMAFLMLAWGLFSAATALVASLPELVAVRFLLGAAEAGFSPGVILYLGLWFPAEWRGRALSMFMAVTPLGLVIGGPLSAVLLRLDGHLGLAGWQWLLLVEAAPTLLLSLAVWRWLTDRPTEAVWLGSAARAWLVARLAAEAPPEKLRGQGPVATALRDPSVCLLVLGNLALGTAGIGAIFFMPLIIQSLGFSISGAGLLTALPGIAGGLALPLWGWLTDRTARKAHVVAHSAIVLAAGLVGAAFCLPSAWAILPLCIAMAGFYGSLVAFWTLPLAMLHGAVAAVGIALINIAGNLGTFSGPYLIGALTDLTGSFRLGLIAVAGLSLAGALAVLAVRPNREAAP